jgi:hypothetical protein
VIITYGTVAERKKKERKKKERKKKKTVLKIQLNQS